MTDKGIIIASLIFAIGMIISSWIYIQGGRYEKDSAVTALDNVTGTFYHLGNPIPLEDD